MPTTIESIRRKVMEKNTGLAILAGVVGLIVGQSIWSSMSIYRKRSQLKQQVAAFLQERNAKIQEVLDNLTLEVPAEVQKQVLNSSLTELAAGIRDHKFTSRQAVITYCVRAATVGVEHNLIAQVNFKEAIDMATKKDEARNSMTALPPLYGVPFSVKEQIRVRGLVSTCGYSKFTTAEPSVEDALVVEMLRNEGAIPIVTSNVPQGLFGIVTGNSVYGQAKNPWDQTRSTGGSVGGEAGLVASKCVPFGIGSDLAGSLRIPAMFCGVYAFKPTGKRIPKTGRLTLTRSDVETFKEAEPSIGPIARNVEDLLLVSQSLLQRYEKDPTISYKKFDEESYNRGLKGKHLHIAYFEDTPETELAPAVKNALHETIEALRGNGHKVTAIPFHELDLFGSTCFDLFMTMGSGPLASSLGAEEPTLFNQWRMKLQNFPSALKPLLYQYYSMTGEKRLSAIARRYQPKTLVEFFGLVRQKEFLRNAFLKMWVDKKFDAMIMPVFPTTAIRAKDSEKLLSFLSYNSLTNVLDMPAGFVPIRRVKLEEEVFVSKFNDSITKAYQDNIKDSKGLPVGVQVATMTFEDELCLGIMKQIENSFNFHEFPLVAEIL
jgi:Asp-tRNA(Asn)/Glu-tRNA(Gln) amidotransferase A subunit family amidase